MARYIAMVNVYIDTDDMNDAARQVMHGMEIAALDADLVSIDDAEPLDEEGDDD